MRSNFYLFKEGIKDFDGLMKVNAKSYVDITPKERPREVEFEYKVLLEKEKSKDPKWKKFVYDYVQQAEIDKIKNVVNSAVVLIKIYYKGAHRFFAVTNGFGFNAINKDLIEENFGLITTLNSINKDELKSFDVKNIAEKTKQTRTMVSLPTDVFDFGVDFESDLVRIVSGYCKDQSMGTRITGSDNLILNSDIEFPDLGTKCLSLLETYEKTDYKDNFGFIDNVKPVRTKDILDRLNLNLIKDLNNGVFDDIGIAYPDQIEYERCEYFKISGNGIGNNNEEYSEIDKEVLRNIPNISSLNLHQLINTVRITGFDSANNSPVIESESLYGFLVYQTKMGGDIYVLSNKKWFNISKDYLADLDKDILTYVRISSLKMPKWHKAKKPNGTLFRTNYKYDEGEYNDLVAKQDSDFVYFDKKNFQIPKSKSKIEICDLYSAKNKSLICIKKLRGSSTLSHLFSQGSVSAYLLAIDVKYKEKFVEEILKSKQTIDQKDLDTRRNLTFVYGIGAEKGGDLLDMLPVFSKINLLKHAKSIKSLGFNVEILKIEMVI